MLWQSFFLLCMALIKIKLYFILTIWCIDFFFGSYFFSLVELKHFENYFRNYFLQKFLQKVLIFSSLHLGHNICNRNKMSLEVQYYMNNVFKFAVTPAGRPQDET